MPVAWVRPSSLKGGTAGLSSPLATRRALSPVPLAARRTFALRSAPWARTVPAPRTLRPRPPAAGPLAGDGEGPKPGRGRGSSPHGPVLVQLGLHLIRQWAPRREIQRGALDCHLGGRGSLENGPGGRRSASSLKQSELNGSKFPTLRSILCQGLLQGQFLLVVEEPPTDIVFAIVAIGC